jgi:hypothetical protein
MRNYTMGNHTIGTNNYTMLSNYTMSNHTDDGMNHYGGSDDYYHINYVYSLPTDNSRFVRWSFIYDFNLGINASGFSSIKVSAYISIAFGIIVLIQSFMMNQGKKMNFVRFASEFSAACSIVFAVM